MTTAVITALDNFVLDAEPYDSDIEPSSDEDGHMVLRRAGRDNTALGRGDGGWMSDSDSEGGGRVDFYDTHCHEMVAVTASTKRHAVAFARAVFGTADYHGLGVLSRARLQQYVSGDGERERERERERVSESASTLKMMVLVCYVKISILTQSSAPLVAGTSSSIPSRLPTYAAARGEPTTSLR